MPSASASPTKIAAVAVSVDPSAPVTVSEMVYDPSAWYVWLAVSPLAVAPSPKSQAWLVIVVFTALEPEASTLTPSGEGPDVGDAEMSAVTDDGGGTGSAPKYVWLRALIACANSESLSGRS